MRNSLSLNLSDTVGIHKNLLDKKVVIGQVGVIVEILANNFYEIEFSNKNGETIS